MKRIIRQLIAFAMNRYRIGKYGAKVGKQVKMNGMVLLFAEGKHEGSTISIGDRCVINSGILHNLIGGDREMIIRTIDNGKIRIGNNVGISNSALVARKEIVIRDNVMIGGGCKIYDNDFHPLDFKERMIHKQEKIRCAPVLIDEGAFIGGHSIILKGVRIGKYSVIGAGSVVTSDVPDNEVWAGNPARFIKKIDQRNKK